MFDRSKHNMLIVEDSKLINKIEYEEFSSLGYNCTQAFSLAEARRSIISNRYIDLIMLDIHLPDGEGNELIQSIKKISKAKIIVFTSDTSARLREQIFNYGVLDYFVKGDNILSTIADIDNLISKLGRNKQETILIVDDSKIVCANINKILGQRNYNIISCFSANEALDIIVENDHISLMVLDINLPDMSGEEVLKAVRLDPSKTFPIIALSGISDPVTVSNILKKGGNDFIHKPTVWEEFLLKIDFWIEYARQQKDLKKANRKLKQLNLNLQEEVDKELKKGKLQQKIVSQQSKMAEMGEMIENITHQWKQPLSVVTTIASGIRMSIEFDNFSEEKTTHDLIKLQESANFLSQTIDDFRDFFKTDKEKQNYCVVDNVNQVLKILDAIIRNNNINIITNLNKIRVTTLKNELTQVILNIINNAKDALLEFKDSDNRFIFIDINEVDTNCIITIKDNAGGIPTDFINKIFEPYFTTKGDSDGTGIGLYMSHQIIHDHIGGTLEVENLTFNYENKEQTGAVFTIKIPLDS